MPVQAEPCPEKRNTVFVIGWRLREKRAGYGLAMQGGAIGILYLTVFAAFKLYQLVPQLDGASIALPPNGQPRPKSPTPPRLSQLLAMKHEPENSDSRLPLRPPHTLHPPRSAASGAGTPPPLHGAVRLGQLQGIWALNDSSHNCTSAEAQMLARNLRTRDNAATKPRHTGYRWLYGDPSGLGPTCCGNAALRD